MLATFKAAMQNNGYANVSVDPGSDFYIGFLGPANQIAVLYSALTLQANAQMPDTATGDDLTRLMTMYGLTRRSASVSEGFITITCSVPTTVALGATLSGTNSLIYEVVQGGIYSNGQTIPVQSVDTGTQTNLPVGSVLTWITTPASTQATAVAFSAITGGVDAENDATARARLLQHLQNPPAFGNWQQLAEVAASFDPLVQVAFIYPACNGPGTQHVALTGYQTTSNVNRDIPVTPNLSNNTSAILGSVPAGTTPGTVVTTVSNVPFNIAFKLSIPYPVGAAQNGFGGGWVDFNPWPVPDGSVITTGIAVTAVTSSTQFTVAAKSGSTAISAGVTHIQWIDKSDAAGTGWLVKQARVTAFTDNGNNTYLLTVDTPFPTVTTGDYVFPASQNAQVYLASVLSSFAAMGPGQKTTQPGVLPMAIRKPLTAFAWPDTVDSQFLRSLVNAGAEVASADYWYRDAPSSTGSHPTNNAEPDLPTSIANPPNIYVPGAIGFYPTS